MPLITLPDSSQRHFPQAVSIAELAADIGPGLAQSALAGWVDGRGGAQLVDTAFILEQDATARDPEGLEILRHSCAHLLAMAVKQLYPSAQVTIGPVIEDGFFYDFACERPFTPDDLAQIEARMQALAACQRFSERWIRIPVSPSTEQFSRLFFVQIDRLLQATEMHNGQTNVRLHSVIVHETETGYAHWFREDAANPRVGLIALDEIAFSEAIRNNWPDPELFDKLKRGERFANRGQV